MAIQKHEIVKQLINSAEWMSEFARQDDARYVREEIVAKDLCERIGMTLPFRPDGRIDADALWDQAAAILMAPRKP
jgi:hypothetical protein